MESGATRNYEIWHDKEKSTEKGIEEEEFEESIDPMKALENRVLDSQKEMADLDNLDEIKAMNKKHLIMLHNKKDGTFHQVSDILSVKKNDHDNVELNEYGLTREDEALVQSVKFQKNKRLTEEDEDVLDLKRKNILHNTSNAQVTKAKPIIPIITVKKRRKVDATVKKSNSSDEDAAGIGGLLGAYGSSSDSD